MVTDLLLTSRETPGPTKSLSSNLSKQPKIVREQPNEW